MSDNGGTLTLLVIMGVFLALTAFYIKPKLDAKEAATIERAHQVIAERASAAERNYRLPEGVRYEWFQKIDDEYFLCSHITLIPLPNYTTIIDGSGRYYDPSGQGITISKHVEVEPNRCWTKDQTEFIQTAYYEFRDCTCLVIITYERNDNDQVFDYDSALAWQKSAIGSIPTEWKEID